MIEQEKTASKKRLIIFIALTFVITWAMFLLIPICKQSYGTSFSVTVIAAAMFVPVLSSLITRLVTKEGFGNMYLRPHFKGHVKEYLLVYFGPTVLIFMSAAVYFLIFPGSFDTELTFLKGLLASSGKQETSAYDLLITQVSIVVVFGPLVNILPTLGEEIGWRGYLLPKLRMFISDRAALIVTGAIWGVWHLPIIAMGHNYGTGYPGYPWLGILAMTIFCIVLGIIEGYVSMKLQSAIPAAMIHSSVNAGAALPVYLLKGSYNPLLGPAISGLFGGLPVIALAAVLYFKSDSKAPLRKDAAHRQEGVTLTQHLDFKA